MFQSAVPTFSTITETSKASDEQSINYEEMGYSEKETVSFPTKNDLNETHIMDSNDEMEETDCIPNIFDNAGDTGKVPPIKCLEIDSKTTHYTSNMDITCGVLAPVSKVEQKIVPRSNTYTENNGDLGIIFWRTVLSVPCTIPLIQGKSCHDLDEEYDYY